MLDPNSNPYEVEGYEPPVVPYIPYASSVHRSPLANTDELYAVSAGSPETPPAFPAVLNPANSTAVSAPSTTPPKKRRRTLWIALSAIVAVLAIGSIATFAIVSYINRPTPMKTLDVFCNALQHEDYQVAYNQFSKQMQSRFSETDFADILAQDKVVSCTHGKADDGGKSATTNLKLVHDSKGVNQDMVTLTRDANNEWKIDDLRRA